MDLIFAIIPDDEIRSLGIRCIATFLDMTNRGPDMPLSLGTVAKPTAVNHETHNNDVSATVRRASTRISEIAKGLATGSQSYRPIILQSSRLTARVVYKVRSVCVLFQRLILCHLTTFWLSFFGIYSRAIVSISATSPKLHFLIGLQVTTTNPCLLCVILILCYQ